MGVASGKARTQAPTGEEDVESVPGNQKASRAPFTHRHSGKQALGKQGRLHGGGDLASEPGRLCRSLAGGGQSRGEESAAF